MSFKFDRVFAPHASYYEVFTELEEPLISLLDGFNVTLLGFGQHGSGKTHSVLGQWGKSSDGLPSLDGHGVQIQALQQLFTIAGHRMDRYKDAFSMTYWKCITKSCTIFWLELSTQMNTVKSLSAKHVIKETDTSTVNVWSLGSSKLEIRTNIDETIGTLRFRTRMKKVSIGKGTKHIIGSKEEVEWKCLCSVDV